MVNISGKMENLKKLKYSALKYFKAKHFKFSFWATFPFNIEINLMTGIITVNKTPRNLNKDFHFKSNNKLCLTQKDFFF